MKEPKAIEESSGSRVVMQAHTGSSTVQQTYKLKVGAGMWLTMTVSDEIVVKALLGYMREPPLVSEEYVLPITTVSRVSVVPTEPAKEPNPAVSDPVLTTASAHEIRVWASANGFDIPSRGRILKDVVAAYRDAHPSASTCL